MERCFLGSLAIIYFWRCFPPFIHQIKISVCYQYEFFLESCISKGKNCSRIQQSYGEEREGDEWDNLKLSKELGLRSTLKAAADEQIKSYQIKNWITITFVSFCYKILSLSTSIKIFCSSIFLW